MNFLYNTIIGRWFLNMMLHTGILKIVASYLKTGKSKWLINKYIRKYDIDMTDFENQTYGSFADFFAREKSKKFSKQGHNVLISPCDGLLSSYNIREDSSFFIKGSYYRLEDLIPKKEHVKTFVNGSCMIFRLEASDYHHFCYVDDCIETGAKLIPGELHSVQPIALAKVPVFRLNRRYYHLLETDNFGPVMQIEVGAVLVGDVRHERSQGRASKGEEMGRFELCGSTIILLFNKEFREHFKLDKEIKEQLDYLEEYPIKIGSPIGVFDKNSVVIKAELLM